MKILLSTEDIGNLVIYMKYSGIQILACILLLQTICMGQVYSELCFDLEWTLEPGTNGEIYVKATITMEVRSSSFMLPFSKKTPIRNMKAWEAETEKSITITETEERDTTIYTLDFGSVKRKGFQFLIEYDQSEMVEELDEIYRFEWGWEFFCEVSQKVTVILPENHELLETDYVDPVKVSSHQDCLHLVVSENVPQGETFRIGVTFSQKGVELIETAETHFQSGKYEESKRAYEKASAFYLLFSDVYGRDAVALLLVLMDCIRDCDMKLAEEKYEEAVQAFDNGKYTRAQICFQKAQELYKSAGDSWKFDECQDKIEQCTRMMEVEELKIEAEALFNEGVSLLEQQQYAEAKTKFEEALVKYTELEDEDKIQECEEQIASCQEELDGGGFCTGSSLIVTAFLGVALIRVFRQRG